MTSPVNLNVLKVMMNKDEDEQSIVCIRGKTAPLLNNLQQQAVQGKGKTTASMSQMNNWEQN